MTKEEEKDYISAKNDIMKALSSIKKLKPEQQKQLAEEIFGIELCASMLEIINPVVKDRIHS